MSIELAPNKNHIIIKRDGREEVFNHEKLYRVALWACSGKNAWADILLESLEIKINNKMKIQTLYDELIQTAVSKISDIAPFWDQVAANLLLLKIYKETYNLKVIGSYPDYSSVAAKGVFHGVYGKDIFGALDPDEILALGDYIKPERDSLFTYKGLVIFSDKYCINYSKRNKLELPQHAYMRMAIYDFHNEPKGDRLQLIKDQYDYLSKHDITLGTPHAVNGGTPKSQIASCVLSTVDDSTFSINDIDSNMAVYSKFSGGLACDVSAIRAKGATVAGNRGYSGGVIPFIQKFEKTVSAWNQGGTRSGSCVITFPFWHLEVMDLLPLKDAGGTEDKRARKLQYAMTIPDILKRRSMADENITLFCPHDVPMLLETYGKEFDRWYEEYEQKPGVRRKTVKARDVLFPYLKYRQQTGNVYATFIDNINWQNMPNRFSGNSNLCTEIVVPSRPSKHINTSLITLENGSSQIIETKTAGEIGLCNLASINLLHYQNLPVDDRYKLVYTLLRAMDNAIETQFYPVKEAMYSNKKYRPIGIGVLNYVAAMADKKIKITDEAALLYTHTLMEDLSYNIYSASVQLAKERGRYEGFKGSLWGKGETPVSVSILHKKGESHPLNFPLYRDWERLGDQIKKFGVRFSYHMAIAPTATSGKAINATESTEPIHNLFYVEEGTQSLPTLANNLKKHRPYYVNAYDVPNKQIIELAAIRQKFLDQAQSINSYHRKPESAYLLAMEIFYAMELGIKTLYYLKTPKAVLETELCTSCT